MKFKIQMTVVEDNGQTHAIEEITILEKQTEVVEDIGLKLSESKKLLKGLEEKIITHQVKDFSNRHCNCTTCQKALKKKGYYSLHYQSLFGVITLDSPRFYECDCHYNNKKSENKSKTFSPLRALFTEHISPERLYLETKWASLFPYAKVVDLFQDVFPMNETLNPVSIKNHLTKIAERTENDLAEEKEMMIEGNEYAWSKLPIPDGCISVGLDGGFVRNWDDKKTHFEVIAGKSIPEEKDMKYFGFVDTYSKAKSKRILFETLKTQGFQYNQSIEFFSDGAENLRNLQYYLSPQSEHYLDWFHITMKITVLQQFSKGLVKVDKQNGKYLQEGLKSSKWYLWHGNTQKALEKLIELLDKLEEVDKESYPPVKKMIKLLDELYDYIENNQHFIPNYGERRRYNEIISTSFVESTINQVVAKRFCKKQQMQWTKKGAHAMLLVRTKVLNGDLADNFRKWYPKFEIQEEKLGNAA